MQETKGGMREHLMLQSAMEPIIEKETEGEPEEAAAAEVTTASPQLSDGNGSSGSPRQWREGAAHWDKPRPASRHAPL
jgi:hypothetical protein